MKSILHSTLFFAAAVLLFAGCEKDLTKHGKAPENIGSISLDRTRIGAGQPVTATCDLPTGGENIASVEYHWMLDNNIILGGKQEGGKSTFAFTAVKTPGEYNVIFKARYVFTGPDKDGNVYKDITTSKTYTVVACDVLNSFWGDALAETQLNRPGLQKYDDKTYVGSFPDPFSTSNLNPPLIPTMYTFTDGKLSRVSEIETYASTAPDAFFHKYLIVRLRISKMLGVNPVREVITWTETSQSEVFDPNGDDAYKTRIGQGIMDHKASIVSVFQGGKSDILLEVFSATSGAIDYMRTYQPAGTLH